MFEVILTNKAEKQYGKLEPKMHARVKELLDFLQSKPVPAGEYDTNKLAGEEDSYRIRLSSFRVTYKIYWKNKTIGVAKIERKSDHTYG